MPKGFTDHEKELIRSRLLEQGYRMFSVHGLKKTNIDELAQAASISKGAFYIFYASKEALFMEVIEQAEVRVRQEILKALDLPGPSPRERLYTMLKKAFDLFETIPILRFITGGDYDQLFRRIPPETLQTHMANDTAFMDELIARCRQAGIPIQVPTGQIIGLLYPLALTLMHKDDLGPGAFTGNVDLLLKLVAAYCLGEVEV